MKKMIHMSLSLPPRPRILYMASEIGGNAFLVGGEVLPMYELYPYTDEGWKKCLELVE